MSMMVRWNPLREMLALQSALDRVWEESSRAMLSANGSQLALDVYETDTNFIVKASLPGVEADHIQVNWHDDLLTISAELAQAAPENAHVHMQERFSGKVSRSIRLSRPINPNAVEAVYEAGVLTLTLPKTPDAQPRQIPVRTTISAN